MPNSDWDLTDSELDQLWIRAQEKRITPLGDQFNIAVTPRMAITLINIAIAKAGSNLNDRRFKKLHEEILPAISFCPFSEKNREVVNLYSFQRCTGYNPYKKTRIFKKFTEKFLQYPLKLLL